MKFPLPRWPAWVPDGIRLFPWLSFLSILLGIAGLVSNAIWRHKAIGHPVSAWSLWFDAQMLLSGTSIICGAIITFGFKEGAKISFWVRARNGMTLSDIHYAWESTASVAEAVKAIRRGKSLLTAWMSILFVIAIPANAWLWAHSLYQDDVLLGRNGTANIHITPNIISSPFASVFAINHPIMTAYRGYLTSTAVQFPADICDKCVVETLGFGWSEMCSVSTSRQFNFEAVLPAEGTQTLFSIDIRDEPGPSGHLLTVNTTHKSETSCTGNYVTYYCELTPSMVQYRLNVTGNSITYTTVILDAAMDYKGFLGDSFLPLNRHQLLPVLDDKRLQLLTKLGQSLYGTKLGTVYGPHWWHYDDDALGTGYQSHIAASYINTPNPQWEGEYPCKLGFKSPMDDIFWMYRHLALRVSVIAAIHTNETQSVPYLGEKIERQWLGDNGRAQLCHIMALVTGIAGIVAVVVLHWGCWKLDRVYSMSSLELMNSLAHGAQSPQSPLPVLAKAKDNVSASRLKKFADEWDAEHDEDKLFAYRKGPDGCWGWEVKVEEHELEERL